MQPKYVHIGSGAAVFWSEPAMMLPGASKVGSHECVLTEDILSCIRVGRLQQSASILGTSVSDARLVQLLARFKRFAIWLDGDGPGQTAASKLRRTLELLGAEVRVIRTELDPKLHSNEEIRMCLM
jgi:hypothetical protein